MTVATGNLTGSVESRNKEPNIKPVWERTITFPVVSGNTTGLKALNLNGILRHITYVTPDTSNNDLTSEMAISDNADNEIFTTGSGIAEDTVNNFSVDIALSGEIDIDITFNEDVAVSADFTVILRGV